MSSERLRRVAITLAAMAVGIAAAWLGMRAFAADTVSMGPFTVDLESKLGVGRTVVALPPLGEMRLDTHDAPVRLSATLTDVDVERLAEDLKDRSTADIAREVEADARSRLGPFALRTLGTAALAALAAGVVVFRRRWRLVATATLTATFVVGASLAVTWRTYRPQAFAEPKFVGTLRVAPQLLGPAREVSERLDQFRANLERIVGGAIKAYAALEPQTIGGRGELSVLHISDVHLNSLGMDFAIQIARGFDVDLVIDTGDLTSYGTPVEEAIVSQVPRFRRPYLFVRGNHDSVEVAERVAETKVGRVLDGDATTVKGLRVYGVAHPVFTEDQERRVDSEAIAEGARAAAAGLAADVDALEESPDVVAVHDDRMATELAGRVPVVLSGHFHRARATTIDGTLFLRAGTTGAAGVNMFGQDEPVPLSASVLYFERGPTPKLIAYDLIEQSPTTGRLTIQRHVTVDEPRPSPSPTPTLSP